jgi:uncharacterized metal-binding protein
MHGVQELLKGIGPRGSATEGEHNAANVVAEQLVELGLQPERHAFVSATSAYSPLAVAAGAVLVSVFLFWQPQSAAAAAAALLAGATLIAAVLELKSRDNPLRWVVPTGNGASIFARSSGSDAQRPAMLVTAHLDTARTPALLRSPGARGFARALIYLTLAATTALVVLYVVGTTSGARALREIALIPAAVVLLAFVLLLQAANSPYSEGANDNASGVAVALALAERVIDQPLANHDVVFAFTGCAEVGGYGLNALLKGPLATQRPAAHVIVDAVAGQSGQALGPTVDGRAANARLIAVADGVIARCPELNARAARAAVAPPELSLSARRGVPALALSALAADGLPPNWRSQTDTTANVDPVTLERAAEFAWQLLRALDAEDRA